MSFKFIFTLRVIIIIEKKKVRTKREVEVLFYKPITVSIDDMDKFEKKDMKKKRPVKNT